MANRNSVKIIFIQKYSEALQYMQEALKIREKHLPTDHSQLADTHNNIGLIHGSLDDLDLAMKQRSLPTGHLNVTMALSNVGLIYEKKQLWPDAQRYFQQGLVIYQRIFSAEYPILVEIQRLNERVEEKLRSIS